MRVGHYSRDVVLRNDGCVEGRPGSRVMQFPCCLCKARGARRDWIPKRTSAGAGRHASEKFHANRLDWRHGGSPLSNLTIGIVFGLTMGLVFGKFRMPTDAPVDRLLTNIQAYVEANPEDGM